MFHRKQGSLKQCLFVHPRQQELLYTGSILLNTFKSERIMSKRKKSCLEGLSLAVFVSLRISNSVDETVYKAYNF